KKKWWRKLFVWWTVTNTNAVKPRLVHALVHAHLAANVAIRSLMDGHRVPKQYFAQQFAQALMLEQTRFIKKQLLAEQNNPYIEQFIHHLYTHSDQVSLKQCIQLEALQDVVQKYAFELNLGAEILEFIGMVAQRIHHLALNSQTQISELLSDESFELWLYKILELDQLRHYIHSNLLHDPQMQHVSLQLANQILESNTPWLDHLRKLNTHEYGLGSKILSFIQDQRSEEHTSELQSRENLVCRLLLEKQNYPE